MLRDAVSEHLEIALENAEDKEAIFHLRQALQLLEIPDEEIEP